MQRKASKVIIVADLLFLSQFLLYIDWLSLLGLSGPQTNPIPTIIAAVLALCGSLLKPRNKHSQVRLASWLFATQILCLLIALYSSNFGQFFIESVRYIVGPLTLVAASIVGLPTKRAISAVVWLLFFVVTLQFLPIEFIDKLSCMVFTRSLPSPSAYTGVSGIAAEPSYMSFFFITLLAVGLKVIPQERLWLLMLLLSPSVFLTGSAYSVGSFFIFVFIYVLVYLWLGSTIYQKFLFSAASLIAVGSFATLNLMLKTRLGAVLSALWGYLVDGESFDQSGSVRFRANYSLLEAAGLLGLGPDADVQLFGLRPQTYFLSALVDFGVVFLLLALSLAVWAMAINALRCRSRIDAAVFFAFIPCFLFWSLFQHQVSNPSLWYLLGVLGYPALGPSKLADVPNKMSLPGFRLVRNS